MKVHMSRDQILKLLCKRTMLTFDQCKQLSEELDGLTFTQKDEVAATIKTIAKGIGVAG